MAENGKGQYQLDLLETITTAPRVWHSWNHLDSCKYFYQNVRLQSAVCARWDLWKSCEKGYADDDNAKYQPSRVISGLDSFWVL